ncbi:MAG: TIGR00730 family Rossman fold protein [bacterium]|nr:TIGR00730 family Rossman fold protein [bacterium]
MPPKPAPARAPRERRRRSVLPDLLPRIQRDEALSREETLVREMVETSLKLLRDRTSLGDLKLVNAALRELRYALGVSAPYRGVRKVSAFGSARTPPGTPTYRTAAEFSRRIAERGYMIITGGGNGIMRACQEGAGRERSFGFNIRLPFEQGANEFISNDPKLVTFRYFFTRKLMFIKEADALVLFPGGFGTHDEGYEALTLAQTGKSHPMPIVFVDAPRGTYWKTWQRYVDEHLLRKGLISPDDLALFKVTTDVDEAVEEITGFYRLYHSSRYVGSKWVIRLNHPLAPEVVRRLAEEFAPLVASGTIEQCEALDDERETEPELNALPRLVFEARRSAFGLRRKLIDRINAEA